MNQVSTVGLDLAKYIFQLHGADSAGAVVLRKKLRRGQLLAFVATLPPCTVAMEACASAHYWGREIAKLGHTVKLIAPAYVKPFVKRQKNDMADAEAICEAAQRPTMRFVALKSATQQAAAVVVRTRDLLVRQRTQTINALRGHLTEFGVIAAKGLVHTSKLIAALEDPASDLPQAARAILAVLVEELRSLDERVAVLAREIARHAKENAVARRLMTIPGIGAVTAAALTALAPPAETFRRGRDFAAWLGLTPVQRSSGGKDRLGKTSKMGERALRRLLIIGASAVARWAARKGVPAGSWPSRRGCCHTRPSPTPTCRFPASGSSGESFAPGDVAMDDPGRRQRALLQERRQALPCVGALPIPSRQPSLPDPHNLMSIPVHPSAVSRHAVVGVMAPHHS